MVMVGPPMMSHWGTVKATGRTNHGGGGGGGGGFGFHVTV